MWNTNAHCQNTKERWIGKGNGRWSDCRSSLQFNVVSLNGIPWTMCVCVCVRLFHFRFSSLFRSGRKRRQFTIFPQFHSFELATVYHIYQKERETKMMSTANAAQLCNTSKETHFYRAHKPFQFQQINFGWLLVAGDGKSSGCSMFICCWHIEVLKSNSLISYAWNCHIMDKSCISFLDYISLILKCNPICWRRRKNGFSAKTGFWHWLGTSPEWNNNKRAKIHRIPSALIVVGCVNIHFNAIANAC